MTMNTPWGHAQDTETIAPGITRVSTASHGGYRLDAVREAVLQAAFPFQAFAGPGWYEEDEDWAAAVIVWPTLFQAHTVDQAVKTVRAAAARDSRDGGGRWTAVGKWLDTKPTTATDISAMFSGLNADRWEPGSMGSPAPDCPSNCWWVSFRRIGDHARQTVICTRYPDPLMSDAEIEAITYRQTVQA